MVVQNISLGPVIIHKINVTAQAVNATLQATPTTGLTNTQIGLLVLIMVLSSVPIISGILFMYWDRITRFVSYHYYTKRFPHRAVEIIMRFPANKFDKIYRLLPDEKRLGMLNGEYHFDEANLSKEVALKDKIIFQDKSKRLCFNYSPDFKMIKEGKLKQENNSSVYYINEDMLNVDKNKISLPVMEYFYNCSSPINFDYDKKEIVVSAKKLKDYKDDNLIVKLLTLAKENMKIMLIIILVALNLIITVFIMVNQMGWVQ